MNKEKIMQAVEQLIDAIMEVHEARGEDNVTSGKIGVFPNLTAKEIVEQCGNKVADGKLLYNIGWYVNEDFYTKEKCRPISLNFTELKYKNNDWNECNNLGKMFNFSEIVYLLSISEEFRKMLMGLNYTWTNSWSSDGRLVYVGSFDADGARVNGRDPGGVSGRLGVSFSRSV